MDLVIREEFRKKAIALCEEYPVVDAHLDLAGEILIREKLGEREIIRSRYLSNWKKAGLNLIVSSIYVPNDILQRGGVPAAWEDALSQIKALNREIEDTGELMTVKNRGDLQRAVSGEKIGVLVYMEGLDCIGEDLGRLSELSDLGVRGASLTWSRRNALGSGCCKAGQRIQIRSGLTELGRKAIREMERLSLFLDVSHLNDDGFEDVKRIAQRPFCATHSCAKAMYENYRNLTDEQMEALASQGGVMGLNGCKYIAGSLAGNHLEMLCRHAEYEVSRMGAAHVGFGFDLCDSYDAAKAELDDIDKAGKGKSAKKRETELCDCLPDHGSIPLLSAALLQRGMEEETVRGIMGGNFVRYFENVLPAR